MKKKSYTKRWNRLCTLLVMLGVLAMVVVSCSRDKVTPFPTGGDTDTTGTDSTVADTTVTDTPVYVVNKGVVVISIDGVSGTDAQGLAAALGGEAMNQTRYSLDVLSSTDTTDAGATATLLTGTTDHGIGTTNNDFSGGSTTTTFLKDIKTAHSDYHTAAVTSWADLGDYLNSSVDKSVKVNSDELVKDSSIALLQSDSALGALFIDFHGVEEVGNANGYGGQEYGAALGEVAGYVQEIIGSLGGRANIANEDWLFVLTTNHGGAANNQKPGFAFYINKNLTPTQEGGLAAPKYSTIHFTGTDDGKGDIFASILNGPTSLYDFGTDQDFTVQFQGRFNASDGKGNYPGIIGKAKGNGISQTSTGWAMYLGPIDNTYNDAHGGVIVAFGGTDNGGTGRIQVEKADGKLVLDSAWHTVTLVVSGDASSRKASIYVDGEVDVSDFDITGVKDISTDALLRLGGIHIEGSSSTPGNFYAANLMIFKAALSAADVTTNYAATDMASLADKDDLIGYWPLNDGAGAILQNQASAGYNFMLHGDYKWATPPDAPTKGIDITSGTGDVVPQKIDLAANVLHWFGISNSLTGDVWISD